MLLLKVESSIFRINSADSHLFRQQPLGHGPRKYAKIAGHIFNSMIANDRGAKQQGKMKIWCDKAVDDLGRRERSETVTLPIGRPKMACKCTIAQKDSHSCGPLILREIEKLMDLPVEDEGYRR